MYSQLKMKFDSNEAFAHRNQFTNKERLFNSKIWTRLNFHQNSFHLFSETNAFVLAFPSQDSKKNATYTIFARICLAFARLVLEHDRAILSISFTKHRHHVFPLFGKKSKVFSHGVCFSFCEIPTLDLWICRFLHRSVCCLVSLVLRWRIMLWHDFLAFLKSTANARFLDEFFSFFPLFSLFKVSFSISFLILFVSALLLFSRIHGVWLQFQCDSV